jgi:hypothetical protein
MDTASPDWSIPWPDRFGQFWLTRTPRLALAAGKLESWLLRSEARQWPWPNAVYVSSLARAGTTSLLQWLSAGDCFAVHRYADYPLLTTPYFWNWLRQRLPRSDARAVPRMHGDGILVTRESPEGFEEALWQQFAPTIGANAASAMEDASWHRFRDFYLDHLRLLQAIHGKAGYLSKGNALALRAPILLNWMPAARFLVPIRSPLSHVSSLCRMELRYQNAPTWFLDHLAARGHQEFGAQRALPDSLKGEDREHAQQDFADQRIANAWLRVWCAHYEALHEIITLHPRNLLLFSHESLYAEGAPCVQRILDFLALPEAVTTVLLHKAQTHFRPPRENLDFPVGELDAPLQERARDLHARLISGLGH